MDISAALAADLRTLSETLDHAEAGLEPQLRRLIADIRLTSRSYLGLALTIVSTGASFTIVSMADSSDRVPVRSSAALSLVALCDVEAGSTLEFYAAESNAFVHFAAEVSTALGLPSDRIVLDQHLSPRRPSRGIDGLATSNQVNRAIGILIERGRPLEHARAELQRAAERDGVALDAAAEAVIRSTQLPG